ncbi:MAG TPA: hypothetical protein VFS29_08030 [Motilibacteraceae bacterium]|nr:hypothetical protein [Motilibacteraceae bacterium]
MSRTGRRGDRAALSSTASDPARGRTRRAARMLAAAGFFVAIAALEVLAVQASTRSDTDGRSGVWAVLAVSTAVSAALWAALLRRWWIIRRAGPREPSRRSSWVRVAAPVGAGLGILIARVLSAAVAAAVAGFVTGLALVAAVSFGWLAYRILSGRPLRVIVKG